MEKDLAICHSKIIELTEKLNLEIKLKDIAIENQKSTSNFAKTLEAQIEDMQRVRAGILNKSKQLAEKIGKLETENSESKTKIDEALQIVEAAIMEKDAAVSRERSAESKISRSS